MYDIVLLGSAGFFASHLIPYLLAKGKRVLALDREPPVLPGDCAADFLPCDLEKPHTAAPPARSIETDMFIYNAVRKGRFEKNSVMWQRQGAVSAAPLEAVFSRMRISCRRVITIGTSEEYGIRHDAREILEDEPCAPLTSYGYWKHILYEQSQTWCAASGCEHMHLRPFILFGRGQDPSMFLHQCITTLLHDRRFPMTEGRQCRDFIHVAVFCRCISRLLELQHWPFSVCNIATPHYHTIAEVAQKVHAYIRKGTLGIGDLPYCDFEIWHQKPSLARFLKVFDTVDTGNFTAQLHALIDDYALQGKQPV